MSDAILSITGRIYWLHCRATHTTNFLTGLAKWLKTNDWHVNKLNSIHMAYLMQNINVVIIERVTRLFFLQTTYTLLSFFSLKRMYPGLVDDKLIALLFCRCLNVPLLFQYRPFRDPHQIGELSSFLGMKIVFDRNCHPWTSSIYSTMAYDL